MSPKDEEHENQAINPEWAIAAALLLGEDSRGGQLNRPRWTHP